MKTVSKQTADIPDPITTSEAAVRLGVSEQQVRNLLRSGTLLGRQLGKQWILSEVSVARHNRRLSRENPPDQRRKSKTPRGMKALSFFSGAMGMDLGLERAGIHVLLACEMDRACRRTILANRPEIGLLGDVNAYSAGAIRAAAGLGVDEEIDVVVGGPPCQAFSTAGARRSFEDSRGNVFLRFIELVLELRPKYAVIENVRGLLSAPLAHRPHSERPDDWTPTLDELPGGALLHVLEMLRKGGYGVSFNLYNAANYGVPQSRERVIILCSRDGARLPHLKPTHSDDASWGLPAWKTLREALAGLNPKSGDSLRFPEDRLRFYRMLQPGQYWKHLPNELHREALGASYFSGGGKTGFLRRLAWDRPSCTLVTSPAMPATDICHPEEDRPLSVQEYKRIQQFPDDWVVSGSIAEQYRQVGNAVPVGLGEAVGRAIMAHSRGIPETTDASFPFSRYRGTDDITWEKTMRRRLESTPGSARRLKSTTQYSIAL